METEESEREEGGGSLGEQEDTPDVEAAESGDEKEQEEGIDGGESDRTEEVGQEETWEVEEKEGQGVEETGWGL